MAEVRRLAPVHDRGNVLTFQPRSLKNSTIRSAVLRNGHKKRSLKVAYVHRAVQRGVLRVRLPRAWLGAARRAHRPKGWLRKRVRLVVRIAGTKAPVPPPQRTTGPAQAASSQANSADRLIFWVDCDSVLALSNAELDTWKNRGVDGFVCMIGHIRGMGGSHDFTGDPGAPLAVDNYSLQRRFRDSDIVGRARSRGMKMYLGVKLVNYFNDATPLKNWFDDAGWSNTVLPKMRDLAGAARLLGFAGLAFDQELYSSNATWNWNYPGNDHPEDQVRAKARQRGHELMKAIVGAYPGVELVAYDVELPESWEELVQKVVNGKNDAFAPRLDIDFWDGLSSVEGYGAIRLIDAVFYKTPHLGTWESAFQYQYNRLYSYLSRRLSNWNYASSRFHIAPFSWIDRGPCGCPFQEPRRPDYVAEQLNAFRKWGMGGEYANYAFGGLEGFDYEPYASAMRSASAPGVVDAEAPTLTIRTTRRDQASGSSQESLALEGTAVDNLAIRAVAWRNDRGGAGVARLNWEVLSGDYRSRYAWQMRWSIPAVALFGGENTITVTAEDIKGLTTVNTLRIHSAGPSPSPGSSSPPGSGSPAAGQRPSARRTAEKKARHRRAKRRCLRRARARRTRAGRRAAKRRCVARYRAQMRRLRAK
jgi:hypothetical protein